METGNVTIGIVTRLDIWAAGLKVILADAGWTVTGHWNTLEDAARAGELDHTQVLVVAKRLLPETAEGGLSITRPLETSFDGRVIVVLEPDDEFTSSDFAGLDVDGLILSSASEPDLNDCITSVGNGRCWIDPRIRGFLSHARQQIPEGHDLSSRELDVARLAAAGLSNKTIARRLGISDGTVKMHMHHILAKLRLTSRISLVSSFGELSELEAGALVVIPKYDGNTNAGA